RVLLRFRVIRRCRCAISRLAVPLAGCASSPLAFLLHTEARHRVAVPVFITFCDHCHYPFLNLSPRRRGTPRSRSRKLRGSAYRHRSEPIRSVAALQESNPRAFSLTTAFCGAAHGNPSSIL